MYSVALKLHHQDAFKAFTISDTNMAFIGDYPCNSKSMQLRRGGWQRGWGQSFSYLSRQLTSIFVETKLLYAQLSFYFFKLIFFRFRGCEEPSRWVCAKCAIPVLCISLPRIYAVRPADTLYIKLVPDSELLKENKHLAMQCQARMRLTHLRD